MCFEEEESSVLCPQEGIWLYMKAVLKKQRNTWGGAKLWVKWWSCAGIWLPTLSLLSLIVFASVFCMKLKFVVIFKGESLSTALELEALCKKLCQTMKKKDNMRESLYQNLTRDVRQIKMLPPIENL